MVKRHLSLTALVRTIQVMNIHLPNVPTVCVFYSFSILFVCSADIMETMYLILHISRLQWHDFLQVWMQHTHRYCTVMTLTPNNQLPKKQPIQVRASSRCFCCCHSSSTHAQNSSRKVYHCDALPQVGDDVVPLSRNASC